MLLEWASMSNNERTSGNVQTCAADMPPKFTGWGQACWTMHRLAEGEGLRAVMVLQNAQAGCACLKVC